MDGQKWGRQKVWGIAFEESFVGSDTHESTVVDQLVMGNG